MQINRLFGVECGRTSMGVKIFQVLITGAALALTGAAMHAQQADSGQNPGQGGRGRGMGGFPGGGRGILGSVTEVAADHYTIKTDNGETYTVHFSANTRIVKQAPGQGMGQGGGQGRRQSGATS